MGVPRREPAEPRGTSKWKDSIDLTAHRVSWFAIRVIKPLFPSICHSCIDLEDHPPDAVGFAAFDQLDACLAFEGGIGSAHPLAEFGGRRQLPQAS